MTVRHRSRPQIATDPITVVECGNDGLGVLLECCNSDTEAYIGSASEDRLADRTFKTGLVEEHRRRPARRGKSGRAELQHDLTVRGKEVHSVVQLHRGDDLVGTAEPLQNAQHLVIAMRGARKRVEIDLPVDRDDRQALVDCEAGHRRADRTEAHDEQVDRFVGQRFMSRASPSLR